MSYGWDRQANLRLVADTVDKIHERQSHMA